MKIDQKLLKYATEVQKKYIEKINEVGSITATARYFGVCLKTIQNALKSVNRKAASKGYSPKYDLTHEVPDPFIVKGTSTLYDKNGNISAQWVKTKIDNEKLSELVKMTIDSYCKDVPKITYPKIDKKRKYEQLLAVYPIADLHIGMLAWKQETENDYNTEIAEGLCRDLVTKLIDRSPACEECLIENLGDILHVDNLRNTTERSGNVLDVDGRYAKIFRVAIRLVRYCIEYAAMKHKKVTVINTLGNHDDLSSLVLSTALSNIYENEPRVVIRDEPTPRHYYEYGNTLIMTTHGHEIKAKDLPICMATQKAELWGRTKYHYIHTGHIHQDQVVEVGNCKVESFRTIAGKDSWTNAKGYMSGRDLKCIIIDKNHGEIERYTISIDGIDISKYRK